MKGKLEVYKNYGSPEEELILEENNLVVDSAAEMFVDLLTTPSGTRVYSPTQSTNPANTLYDASNYRVQALSFGKAKPQYQLNAYKFPIKPKNLLSNSNNFVDEGVDLVEWNRNLLSRNVNPISGEASGAAYFNETSGGWLVSKGVSSYASGATDPAGQYEGNTLYMIPNEQPNVLVEGTSADGGHEYMGHNSVCATDFHAWKVTAGKVLTSQHEDYKAGYAAQALFSTANTYNATPRATATTNTLQAKGNYRTGPNAGDAYITASGFFLSGIQSRKLGKEKTATFSVYYNISALNDGYPADITAGPEFSAVAPARIALAMDASSFFNPEAYLNLYNTQYATSPNNFSPWTSDGASITGAASSSPWGPNTATEMKVTGGNRLAYIDFINSDLGLVEGDFYGMSMYIKKSLSTPPASNYSDIQIRNAKAAGNKEGAGIKIRFTWDGSTMTNYTLAAPGGTGSNLEGFAKVSESVGGWYQIALVIPRKNSSTYRDVKVVVEPQPGGNGALYVVNFDMYAISRAQYSPAGISVPRTYGDTYESHFIQNTGERLTFDNQIRNIAPVSGVEDASSWRRISHESTFSSTPDLFKAYIGTGYTEAMTSVVLSHPQIEKGSPASLWSDSSTICVYKGIDEDGLGLTPDALPTDIENGLGVLDKNLTYSIYANPSGLYGASSAGTTFRFMDIGNALATPNTTLVSMGTPGVDSYTRQTASPNFSSYESTHIGIAMEMSGVSAGNHCHLAHAQLEYDGNFKLPEAHDPHYTSTPTPWVSSIGVSSVSSWNSGNVLHGISTAVSTVYSDSIDGPFPGTKGTLILNDSDVSTLSLQQRIVGRNLKAGVNTYSTTPFYNRKMTASVYLKYPFTNPPGVSPDASGSTTGLARRSEIALYPGIATYGVTSLNSEGGYDKGGRLILRWTDVDGAQSPGAGSATIDNKIAAGRRADGTLEYIRNGWYRASVTNTLDGFTVANTSSVVFSVYPVARHYPDMGGSPNAASGGLYVYGAQLELGDLATSYQDTDDFFSTPSYTEISGTTLDAYKPRDDFDWSGTLATSTIYAEQPYARKNSEKPPVAANVLKSYYQLSSEDWVVPADSTYLATAQTTSVVPNTEPTAQVFYSYNTGLGAIYQIVDASALEHGKTYAYTLYLRRRGAAIPANGKVFRMNIRNVNGTRESVLHFDWATSSASGGPLDSGFQRVGSFSRQQYRTVGKNTNMPWWKLTCVFPYDKNDGNGNLKCEIVPLTRIPTSNTYAGWVAYPSLQPVDTSCYTPNPILPDYPTPYDTSLVDDYMSPMAQSLELSTGFNQNMNFIGYKDTSTVNINQFKAVEILPHNTLSEDPSNDLSGAFGLNSYYLGSFPPGSASPISYAIVSSLDTSEGLTYPTVEGTYGGYFNQVKSMDPSGFLRAYHPSSVDYGGIETTSGLVTSSNPDFSSTGEVSYITTVASGDLGLANLYGGITQLGLWGFDVPRMVKEGRLPPYYFDAQDANDAVGNNLAYRLICKKVLNQNITNILDGSGPGAHRYNDLTLVWRLNFL